MFSDDATAQASKKLSKEWIQEGTTLFRSAKTKLDHPHKALTFDEIEKKIANGVYRKCTEFKSAMVRYP